jgi:mycothiol system anti-sigma-R factor
VDLSEIDCNQVLIEIESYIDREVEVARYEEIEVHLGACAPCLEHAEFKTKLKAIISAKCCSEAVPPQLMERIRQILVEDTGS